MAERIDVYFREKIGKDESTELESFKHRGRSGGSYTVTARFEGGWLLIEDEWGKTTAFPSDLVERVEVFPSSGY